MIVHTVEDTNEDRYVEIDRCTMSQSFSPDDNKSACGTYENDTCSARTISRPSLNVI